MPRVSEKGQGWVEYTIILVLVAITVIAANMILVPKLSSYQASSVLPESPVVGYEPISPSFIGSEVSGSYSVRVKYGCRLVYVISGYDLKVATQYPHIEELSIARVDATHYQFCSLVPAAEVIIQIAYVEKQ